MVTLHSLTFNDRELRSALAILSADVRLPRQFNSIQGCTRTKCNFYHFPPGELVDAFVYHNPRSLGRVPNDLTVSKYGAQLTWSDEAMAILTDMNQQHLSAAKQTTRLQRQQQRQLDEAKAAFARVGQEEDSEDAEPGLFNDGAAAPVVPVIPVQAVAPAVPVIPGEAVAPAGPVRLAERAPRQGAREVTYESKCLASEAKESSANRSETSKKKKRKAKEGKQMSKTKKKAKKAKLVAKLAKLLGSDSDSA